VGKTAVMVFCGSVMEAFENAPAVCSAAHRPWGRRGPSAACGAASPKGRSVISSASPGPPSLHSRFGDGLDGRRQIGSTPAAGDVGSADTPRAPQQAPPTNEPDEPRGPVLGETTLLFLAGKHETAARPLVDVVLVPAITARHTNPAPTRGPVVRRDRECPTNCVGIARKERHAYKPKS
jgi:hypothetical protein